jgi:hypothetical protein
MLGCGCIDVRVVVWLTVKLLLVRVFEFGRELENCSRE